MNYYKIKERNGLFTVTRRTQQKHPFKFEIRAKRILQFYSALLVQNENNKYDLYVTSTQSSVISPTLVIGNISQYRVSGKVGRKHCILALKVENYWTFLCPDSFGYFIHLTTFLNGRLKTMPKLLDSNMPAYFRKDTTEYLFHANGKDYLISPKKLEIGSTEAQVAITEVGNAIPLEPKCFKSVFLKDCETLESLFYNGTLCGQYKTIEPFKEEDYPEEFESYRGYWGKDKNGNIMGLHLISTSSKTVSIQLDMPAKSIHLFNRVHTGPDQYYDIWQISYIYQSKRGIIVIPHNIGNFQINIEEDDWDF